jgi:hypothetical protein
LGFRTPKTQQKGRNIGPPNQAQNTQIEPRSIVVAEEAIVWDSDLDHAWQLTLDQFGFNFKSFSTLFWVLKYWLVCTVLDA